jgi:hypothetical protein
MKCRSNIPIFFIGFFKEKKMNGFASFNKPLSWLVPLLLAAVMAGCGGSDGTPAATPTPGTSSTTVLPGVAGTAGANVTDPTVISASPANLATNVATSTNTWDTATTSNIVTGKLVTATFNAEMDPTTIDSSPAGTLLTFTLNETISGSGIPGTVTMNAASSVATFTPTATALAANTKYTATVTTAAKNAGGTAMPKAVAWSFTTNATVLTGQAPVNLLTAGDFAVLANTAAVTYNGVASAPAITGDVGMATLSSASFAGFANLAVDIPTNDFATADEVVGKLYAPDYTGGPPAANGLTPAKMVLAGTDMTLAYNDGAGRTAAVGAPFLNAGSPTVGTLDGLTLTPGVYTWSGNVISSTSSSVTISGGPNDVWIFQIGGYFRPGDSSNMILSNPSGGAPPQAKNIFWVVAGSDSTLGTTAHVEGVIMTGTGFITLNTGATVNGRLLAHTATRSIRHAVRM